MAPHFWGFPWDYCEVLVIALLSGLLKNNLRVTTTRPSPALNGQLLLACDLSWQLSIGGRSTLSPTFCTIILPRENDLSFLSVDVWLPYTAEASMTCVAPFSCCRGPERYQQTSSIHFKISGLALSSNYEEHTCVLSEYNYMYLTTYKAWKHANFANSVIFQFQKSIFQFSKLAKVFLLR